MDYFYDGQLRRYLNQFMRVMSNFSYKDAKGNIIQIPVRYGDMSRQVAQILNKNSENTIPSAPFISCYIKNLKIARERLQNPYYENTLNVRERATSYMDQDPGSPTYGQVVQGESNVQGANYTINRLMPTPYDLEFQADIWSSNTEQKLQILEQILVLFRPAMEIQTTANFVDWTSLSYLELSDLTWSSRAIPQGVEQDIDIANLGFTAPIWISTPIKVKQLGVITNIISRIFVEPTGTIENNPYDDGAFFNGRTPTAVAGHNLKDLNVIVLNNIATLGPGVSWYKILDAYPGTFIAGISQIRFSKDLSTEVVATLSLNPVDETQMILNIDASTLPTNTQVPPNSGKTYVDAIIDPTKFSTNSNNIGIRYLILEDINPAYRQVQYIANPGYDANDPTSPQQIVKLDANGNPVYEPQYPDASYAVTNFKNSDNSVFSANANDIITWDGTNWSVIFDSLAGVVPTYITNIRTGSQYVWDGTQWTSSYEGEYVPGYWRLLL